MNIRAAIFDVYGTLIQVGPPPADADARWQALFHEFFKTSAPLSRLDFTIACQRNIAAHHEVARSRGIAFPEILWPQIVAEVLPGFARLTAAAQDEFLFRHIQTGRTTRLYEGVADVLQQLSLAGDRKSVV